MWTRLKRDVDAALAALVASKDAEARQNALSGLEAAIDAVAAAAADLAAAPPPEAELAALILSIRNQRLFRQTLRLTGALLDAGLSHEQAKLQHAQAAIELKQFDAARDTLDAVLAAAASSETAKSDAQKALGRLDKQIYVDRRREDAAAGRRRDHDRALQAAVAAYGREYAEAETIEEAYYPGVNLVAMIWRAGHDGVDVSAELAQICPEHAGADAGGANIAADVAAELLADLQPHAAAQRSKPDDDPSLEVWALASCGEALLALELAGRPLDDAPPSAEWFLDYASRVDVPFKLYGTLRQLEEVWLLTADSPIGGEALSHLRNRVIALGGEAHLEMSDQRRFARAKNDPDRAGEYEKLINNVPPSSVQRYFDIFERAKSIGRVHDRIKRRTIGTGFLIPGVHAGAPYVEETLFLTNAHVVSPHAIDRMRVGARTPEEVEIVFGRFLHDSDRHPAAAGLTQQEVFTCAEVIWSSPHAELDAVILRLSAAQYDGGAALPPPLEPMPFDLYGAPDCLIDTAFIIGYPAGGDLSVSDRNNEVRRFRDTGELAFGWLHEGRPDWRFVHYTSSTIGGSSGSPVFTNDLTGVYAIHHFGPSKNHAAEDLDDADARQRIPMLNGRRDELGRPISWTANQGVLLSSILTQAQSDLAAGRSAPAAEATEGGSAATP